MRHKERISSRLTLLSGVAAVGIALAVGCEQPTTPDGDGSLARGGTSSANAPVLIGAGSIASCDSNEDEHNGRLVQKVAGTVFTTGDNVYSSGSKSEFDECYDRAWGRDEYRTRPSPGDKDYRASGASGYFDYFGSRAGKRGEGYYSYDIGAWHVVVLNSSIDMGAGSAQEQWLRDDLAASKKACTLAYWHYPRFSSWSTHLRSEVKPLWDALYEAGAEVVVNGH